MKKIFFNFILFTNLVSHANAQTTIGLIQHNTGSLDNGYILFAPISSTKTYLIDKCGKEVKSWSSNYKPSNSCYILNDGTLLRAGNVNSAIFSAGGSGGIIEKFDWSGNVIWNYTISDATKCQHHDIKGLPNGNVLVIAWDLKTDLDAINHGRNPALVSTAVWSEQILEIQPVGLDSGIVVWEWHLWDHLIQDFDNTKPNYGQINSFPERININYKASATNEDWIHLNSIDYNPALDQILVSSHAFDEIWIIDHSTTTAQAASHTGGNSGKGGDILYRWGNPLAYNTGTTARFFGQHNAHWIDSGLPYQNQIMVFNNGQGRPGGNYSTIDIIYPPSTGFTYNSSLPYLPNSTTWTYNSGNPNNLYAPNVSGAQQLPNGNVLYCNGPAGTFVEIDSTTNVVWKYINPVSGSGIMTQGTTPAQNVVFRCNYYPSSFAGFAGQILTANTIIENVNTVSDSCNLISSIAEINPLADIQIFPNPSRDDLNIQIDGFNAEIITIELYDLVGKLMLNKKYFNEGNFCNLDLRSLDAGCYLIKISSSHFETTKKIIITSPMK